MDPGQDPTEPNDPASLRRQQFIEYLQQQQQLIQQREQQTSNLLALLSQSNSAESTSWNPLLNLSSGFPGAQTSVGETGGLPDDRSNEEYLQFEQEEDELVDDDLKEEQDGPSGSASVPSFDDMPTTSEFVKKLYRMLDAPRFQPVVCWGPLGDCFVVKDMQECTKSILPRLFKHSNFSSFVRQLNKYGFRKVKSPELSVQFGEHSWVFQHPDFRAGHPEALERIKRKPAAPRRNVQEPGVPVTPLPTAGPSTSASPTTPIVRPALRRGLSAPLGRLVPPARTRPLPLAGIDPELRGRLAMLEQNHETLLDEMVSFQQGLAERNEFIQNLIMRSFQNPSATIGMSTSSDTSMANTQDANTFSGQQTQGPVRTVHHSQQRQQQPSFVETAAAEAAAGSFRMIQPSQSFDPRSVLPFQSDQQTFSSLGSSLTSSSTTTMPTTTRTHTRSRSRSHRRYSANDLEALGSSFGLGISPGSSSSASGVGLPAMPAQYAFNFNFNLGLGPGLGGEGAAASGSGDAAHSAEDEDDVDYSFDW